MDKFFNYENSDFGEYYVKVPAEYEQRLGYGLPALEEIYNKIQYPRMPMPILLND